MSYKTNCNSNILNYIIILSLFIINPILLYTQTNDLNKMDEISQKAELKWEYNPFRKSDKERLLFG